MEKAKRMLLNVLWFVVVWYGSQSIVGFIIGVGLGVSGIAITENVTIMLAIAGLITSVIAEIVFWSFRLVNKEEA